MVGEAEKVTEVPAQTGLLDGEIDTLTGRLGLTTIEITFDVAGFPVGQVTFDVKIQYTGMLQGFVGISHSMSLLYVVVLPPTGNPL